jgi:thiol-disulfide isomerase/thioredoxin
VLLVNVWASWCAPCREELPELDSLAATYDSSRVAFVALSDDVDGAAAREYLAVFGGTTHLRVGLGLGRLQARYRYPGLPFTMLVDPAGRIVRTWYGFGGPPQLAAIDSMVRQLAPRAALLRGQ